MNTSIRYKFLSLLLLVVCLSVVWGMAWVGFIGSDDYEYYVAGRALSTSFWNAPDGFGGMRTAVSMPIGLSLRIFGDHEWALILPTALYALATALLTYLALARLVPLRLAFGTTLLFMTLPVVAITSTMASADIAELFWSVAAFWLVMSALTAQGAKQAGLLIAAGVSIALAFAARETAAALGLWLIVGFLCGFALPRLKYFWTALGFFGAMAAECAYFAITAGDALIRFGALAGTRSAATRMVVAPFTFDDTGNLRIHYLIDPVLMLLTKHSFGLLYWMLLALCLLILFTRKRIQIPEAKLAPLRRPMIAALALGLIWALFASVVLVKLRIHPRYYLTPSYFIVVAAALWLHGHTVLLPRRAVLRGAIVMLALGNALGIWLDNKNPRFAERVLADMTKRYAEPIHTDSATAYIAKAFAGWNGGKQANIVSTPTGSGELMLRVSAGIGDANRKSSAISAENQSAATVLESHGTPPLIGGEIGRLVWGAGFIPPAISRKLTSSRSSAELVRLPEAAAAAASAAHP